MEKKFNMLFVNPWIHDFAAYDLFYRPLGLLNLAESMASGPAEITVVDLLDRYNPRWVHTFPHQKDTDAGTGHFFREKIAKPSILGDIPRYFSRYGVPYQAAKDCLMNLQSPPRAIFLASHMTYWYTGVRETANLLRDVFPETPLILGGIYATLMPDHAQKTIKPNLLIQGQNFSPLQKWLKKNFGYDYELSLAYGFKKVWDHYPVLKHYPLISSVGCPYNCEFCASRRLNPTFHQLSVSSILEQIRFALCERNVHHFVFYDDALFVNPDHHIKPLLKNIFTSWGELIFHTPNGLFVRFIDEEMAELMIRARFHEPRLSLETVTHKHRNMISDKVNRQIYLKAVNYLHNAGYKAEDLLTYIMMGLPGQDPEDVKETIDVVYNAGSRISLSSYSPVPGTPLFEKAGFTDEDDPLLHNNSVHCYTSDERHQWEEIRLMVKTMNQQIKR
jgi:hypothetical protein